MNKCVLGEGSPGESLGNNRALEELKINQHTCISRSLSCWLAILLWLKFMTHGAPIAGMCKPRALLG